MPTAQEIIAAKQEEIADARLIIRRFPDARQSGDEWESDGVTRNNAKGTELTTLGTSLPGKVQYSLRLYAIVQRKGHEPVKVYGTKPYRLTADHVQKMFASNPTVVFKTLGKALACQEKK
jgi:hypothetical protein